MTLRPNLLEDETQARFARTARITEHAAAAAAIDLAAPGSDHLEFVRRSTARLLERYADLMDRLKEA